MRQSKHTIAIIGCGPKGLYALDSLCEAARQEPSSAFDVHVFEASPYPGAGPIYDPGQPDYLLMNFPARMIDAWTGERGPSLMDWLNNNGDTVLAGDYVPRAAVGQYLYWSFCKVLRETPPNIQCTIHPYNVSDIEQIGQLWRVKPGKIIVDDVLITTGHQDWTRRSVLDETAMIASPFPTDTALSVHAVPRGASVACKGFALTFLDTMLALSEGRGGKFDRVSDTYSYVPSGSEPAIIAPYSRTGRPMRAKIEADRFQPPQPTEFWGKQIDQFEQLLSSSDTVTFSDQIWPALLTLADHVLGHTPGSATAFYDHWTSTPFPAAACRQELQHGYDIAVGTTPPDIGWAIAEAWRQCYPSLVRWVSHRAFAPADAAFFHSIAAEMERLAFGPPAQNVGKLICLEAAGLVSFDHLLEALSAEVTVDATIPPHGAAALTAPLKGLLLAGHVEANTLGGLNISADAQALVDGTCSVGLSIIGRATEGSVLGNDTLSRALHDLPERWAARMVQIGHVSGTLELEQSR